MSAALRMKSKVYAHGLAQSLSCVQMNSLAPSASASFFLSGECEMAYVSAPRAEAQRSPKWPSPPLVWSHYGTSVWRRVWNCHIHSENGYFLAWASLGANERAEGGNASTQHRCCQLRRDVVWDLEGEVFVCTDMACVTALRDCAIGIRSTICVCSTISNCPIQYGVSRLQRTYQSDAGSSSRCRSCTSCTPDMTKSGHLRRHGLQP